MAVQNPPVKGGFEPPVMSFSGAVHSINIIKIRDDAINLKK
jgi:hypothetical protein